MKVIVNRGSGYFKLSKLAIEELIKLGWIISLESEKNLNSDFYKITNKHDEILIILNTKKHNDCSNKFRSNLDVVKVFEKLGYEGLDENMNSREIEVVNIPDNIEWYIEEDNEGGGSEIIHEEHRIW